MDPIRSFAHGDCLVNGVRGSVLIKIFPNACLCDFYPHDAIRKISTKLEEISLIDNDFNWRANKDFEKYMLYAQNLVFN